MLGRSTQLAQRLVLLPHCDSIAKSNRLASVLAASGGVLRGGRGGSFPASRPGGFLQKNLAPLAVPHVRSGCVFACLCVGGSPKLCGASAPSCLVLWVLIFVSAFG